MRGRQQTKNGTALQELYSALPSVDELLLRPRFCSLTAQHGRAAVLQATRQALAETRGEIAAGQHGQASLALRLESLRDTVARRIDESRRLSLRRVVNATGVILHTNLGRAPLSSAAIEHMAEIAAGYCNLELDVDTGERSRRDVHAESLVLQLLHARAGVEHARSVVVVNNCAAATFLALNSLAEGGEVAVSRGELVEIGGGFRIPEILAKSGARLREVGATNKTRRSDFANAITAETRLMLRVHQSNFSMEGFTERPALADLLSLSRETGVPLFEDQGTGLLLTPPTPELAAEDSLLESYRAGVDLLAASGDKLLGGPQCGLLIGRADLMDRIRANPLLRAFRVEKLTYAALQATLMDHLSDGALSLPIVRMLSLPADEVRHRCEQLAHKLTSEELSADVVPCSSVIGGGTTPRARLESYAIALRHAALSTQELARVLRHLPLPIISRVAEDRVLLDLRTVEPELDDILATALLSVKQGKESAARQS